MRNRNLALAGIVLAATGSLNFAAPTKVAAASSVWTSSASGGPPGGGANAAMAWDAATGNDVLLTTDGHTLTWNGTAWTTLNPAHSPGARSDAAMAYDAIRRQVVLFGGLLDGAAQQDTWTWDGTDWTHRAPSNSPPWRAGASMAWDGNNAGGSGYVLMFGGFDSPGVFYNDTWQWDGFNWNEQVANFSGAGAPSPSPRTLAQMSDNGANKTVVLFGGTNPQGALGDTWVWVDTTVSFGGTGIRTEGHWVPTTPTQSPAGRYGGVMAFAAGSGDARFGGPILFGGAGADGFLQDTWSWDGQGWAQATPTGAPASRRYAVAAAGPGGTMVMAGGVDGNGTALNDTWTWSGSIDAAPLPAPTIASCPVSVVALPTTSGPGTLRGAAAVSHPGLYVGASVTAKEIYAADAEQQITAGSQFNMIASSNQMFWSGVENQPYTFDFCAGDTFVAYAQAYHQVLRYHNLVAGAPNSAQTPNWVLSPTLPWTGTSLSAVMNQYITTVIDHFRGKIAVFDVVNETQNNQTDVAFDNTFAHSIGFPKYVEEAFQDARAANPQATLLYDDGFNWFEPKLTTEESLINDLENAGSAPDAVGFELFNTSSAQVAGLATAMSAFAGLGVKTAVTQMTAPLVGVPPSGDEQAQSNAFGSAMSACLTPASNCFMFMQWGVSDTYSVPKVATNSLTVTWGGDLFDEAYQPRPAFTTVLGLLQ